MLKVLFALKDMPESMMALLDGHNIDMLHDNESCHEKVAKNNYDLVLIEEKIDVISSIKSIDPRVEVILFGYNEMDAIEAIKKGASAYFSFPIEFEKLKNTIDGIQEFSEIRRETAELERLLNTKYIFEGIVGKNPLMLEIISYLRRIAPYYKAVTIMGETGTGKELIAKALHSLSPAGKHQFVTCNCGAFSETLIQSELFGHKKGSFTGAIADKAGLFTIVGEGTIFLDEIAEMSLAVQPFFLGVLQDGEFRPIGSNQTLKARCRVIAATNKDLQSEVEKGLFREDLFYRITPLTIYVPPLRERKDDIPLLCRHFLEKFNRRTGKKVLGISRPAQTVLLSYDWPGNVRKLENVIEQTAIMADASFIRLEDLPSYLKEKEHEKALEPISIDELVKKHIIYVLNKNGGNKSKTAKILGISRRALLRKVDKYSLNGPPIKHTY